MRSTPAVDEKLRLRLEAAVTEFADGSADKFGRLIGYTNGGYVREVINRKKPVREALIDRVHAISQMHGWFADLVPDQSQAQVSPVEPSSSAAAPANTTDAVKWSLSPEEERAIAALRDLPDNKAAARVQQIVEEAEEFRRYLRERAYERGDRRVINITPPHERRERLQSKQVPNPWGPHEPPIIDQQKREEEN